MVPPFIAYYGTLQGGALGRSLMQTAYDQCRLYRDALRDESGLWRHIAQGSYSDNTHWATGASHGIIPGTFKSDRYTGNGWAAAGMMRVLSTLNHTKDGRHFSAQQADLTEWIDEILEESWSHQVFVFPCCGLHGRLKLVPSQGADGALHNVIDDPTSFTDTASTALLASVTYRMTMFKKDASLILPANKAFALIEKKIDRNGWLQGAVDPLTFHSPLAAGQHTPEGQAFVLLLQAAWKTLSDYATSTKAL